MPRRTVLLSTERILRFMLMWLICLPLVAQGSIESGKAWLISQTQSNGSYSTDSDIAIPYQATVASWQALSALGETPQTQTSMDDALNFIDTVSFPSTENIANTILVQFLAGQTSEDLINELVNRLQEEGGLGDLAGYQRTELDTAFALEALATSNIMDTEPVTLYPTIDYLLQSPMFNQNGQISDTASIYVTALTMRALWQYRHDVSHIPSLDINGFLDKAKTYLLNQLSQETHENFELALALIAIAPTLSNLDEVSSYIDLLNMAQLDNGSWDNDVYSTALALRALHTVSNPTIANPDLGQITGVILDDQTNLPLSKITVALSGSTTATQQTDENGLFNFDSLNQGDYSVQISDASGVRFTSETSLSTGQIVDLGELYLLRATNTTVVQGSVIDTETNQPLSNVEIQIVSDTFNTTLITDDQGLFLINDMPAGDVTIQINHNAYLAASIPVTIIDGENFSVPFKLIPDTGTLEGLITDAKTLLGLNKVRIFIDDTLMLETNADGFYRILSIPSGEYTVRMEFDGYTTIETSLTIAAKTVSTFSPQLQPSVTYVAGDGEIKGIVIDGESQNPLANVSISCDSQVITTNNQGHFSCDGLSSGQKQLSFTLDSYQSETLNVELQVFTLNETVDLGSVHLYPENTVALLPDLEAVPIDMRVIQPDWHTLDIHGALSIPVKNTSNTTITQPVDLLAFYDVNLNRQYDTEVDVLYGQTTFKDPLKANTITPVILPVHGQLPYKDAPIYVWLDSEQAIVERNEGNNILTSAKVCNVQIEKDTFELKERWKIDSYYHRYRVMPVVGPLQDTNGDGSIDQYDKPAIIAHERAITESEYGGISAHIVNEDNTTQKLFQVYSYRTVTPALGDIDADGVPEIITISHDGMKVVALNNKGEKIWETETGKPNPLNGSPTIADLDADGQAEILIANLVFDSQGNLMWSADNEDIEDIQQTEGYQTHQVPIAVDLDLDGSLEVLRYLDVYRANGDLYWSFRDSITTIYDLNFIGTGQFDDDPYPEVVNVLGGEIFVFEHDGQRKWGPVYLDGRDYRDYNGYMYRYRGYGAAPTIADFDGDGYSEIGVVYDAPNDMSYRVFDYDGQMKWFSKINGRFEKSSAATFDFDGNGQLELVFHSYTDLYIVDGTTGENLAIFPYGVNIWPSYKNPVIADIDNDGHANIIAANGDIQIFENINNSWMPARGIWNQKTYHVTNVNDDGSIPQYQQNPTSGRQQQQLEVIQNKSFFDLTASRLQIINNEDGQQTALQVRIANAGPVASPDNVVLSFYTLDSTGEQRTDFGTLTLDSFAPHIFQDLQLENVHIVDEDQTIYVAIDEQNSLTECNTGNNIMSLFYKQKKVGIKGIAADATTGQVLANVEVSVHFNDTSLSTMSQADGSFEIIKFPELDGDLALIVEDYSPFELGISLPTEELIDVGTIRLRPLAAVTLLPDLRAESIDTSNMQVDMDSLKVAGSVSITLKNLEQAVDIQKPISLLAFYDADLNLKYDEAVDTPLGKTSIIEPLEANTEVTTSIEIDGELPYRDAPIHVWIDSDQTIAETSEINNIIVSTNECGAPIFNTIDLALCLDSSGSLLTSYHTETEGVARAVENLIPHNNSVRLTVIQLSYTAILEVPPTFVNSTTAAKIARLSRDSWRVEDSTAISSCIYRATEEITSAEPKTDFQIIMVSSDGGPNNAERTREAAKAAEEAGIDVLNAVVMDAPNNAFLEELVFPKPATSDLGYVVPFGTVDDFANTIASYVKSDMRVIGTPDLSVSKFHIVEVGAGSLTLEARIGNGGLVEWSEEVKLTLWQGDPTNGGILLRTVNVNTEAGVPYTDVQLQGITNLANGEDLYAIVDFDNQVSECNEDNNSMSLSVQDFAGKLAIATDAAEYGPNTPVIIDYTVTNQGILPLEHTDVTSFNLALTIEDIQGDTIATLPIVVINNLDAGETASGQIEWNSATWLTGTYQVKAQLSNANNKQVDQTGIEFEITQGNDASIDVTLGLDKPVYHTTDLVQLNALIQNQTLNVLVDDAPLHITVRDPNQQIIYTTTREVQSLTPQGVRELLIPYMLKDAEIGIYTIELAVLDADGTTLASQSLSFEVQESLALVLSGNIDMQAMPSQIHQCTETITNSGTQGLTDLPVQYLLLNVDDQSIVETETATIDLASKGSDSQTLSYFTQLLPAAHYACVLQAQIDGEWKTLDFQVFNHDNMLASECSTMYAIHDQDLNNTQLFTYDLNQRLIAALGSVYPEYDLEGMDIHPYTHKLYASSGHENAILYLVDGFTGDLMPIGVIGFNDVVALSFNATGQLWGWSKQGLIQIDTTTGQGQLVLADTTPVQGLAWNNDGSVLYATASDPTGKNTTLWSYDPIAISLTIQCESLAGEVESLEVLPDDTLAFGIHNDNQLGLYAYDAAACQVVEQAKITTPFNDIEAIAWPTADCTTQQATLNAFIAALSDDSFIDENGKVRITLEGQTYSGQLAELITQGVAPNNGKINLVAIPDANADGLDDFLITYSDGSQQVLYYLGLAN
ncbi:carboxypeptidase regulatory-like domain-containing protein [Candidatus Albibeggiatoa sp. nov. NOAA]|uniref:carboxypeptidase regulatory-like domain-containing protein n=1 Tax=Candidatus Albibeggiatoa sp. nov. NOAA TaxID=3162724 RepID=UPI0032F290AA|nr:carboxypeptidase regulatory-like domain-containing protein [Thiotrichaceae bacterium]